MSFSRIAFLIGIALSSFSSVAKVFILAPGGGLTGGSSLALAHRIDEELHAQGYSFSELVDHGVGISVGAHVVALLLQTENGQTKYSTAQAVDLFLQRMGGTFPDLQNIAQVLLQSHVEKSDLNKVIQAIMQDKVKSLDAESLAHLWNNDYRSYAAFWTKLPEIAPGLAINLSSLQSHDGKLKQGALLRGKLLEEFADMTFADPQLAKVIALASHEGKPVVIGSRAFDFPSELFARHDTSVVDGLMASSALPLFDAQYLDVDSKGRVHVTDGAYANRGLSPLESVVEWASNSSDEDDVIISLGNGGPFDADYRDKIGIHNGFATIQKTQGTIKVFTLEPQVDLWHLSSMFDERGLTEDLIAAANNVPQSAINAVADAMMAHHRLERRDARSFSRATFVVHSETISTVKPDENIERISKGVVDVIGVTTDTARQVIEAWNKFLADEEAMRVMSRVEEEAREHARLMQVEAERVARLAIEETQRLARIAEEEARRIQRDAERVANRIFRSFRW